MAMRYEDVEEEEEDSDYDSDDDDDELNAFLDEVDNLVMMCVDGVLICCYTSLRTISMSFGIRCR